MTIKSILITGANRGIGLELVKQFTELPTPPQYLFAACRIPDKAEDLKAIAKKNPNVKIIKIEVGDEASYKSAVATVTEMVGDEGLNVLFNNAGVLHSVPFGQVTAEQMRASYDVNTIGPLMITQSFYPLLKKASAANTSLEFSCSRAAVINMSGMGSISDNTSGGAYPYRAAKAALNMVNKGLSVDLKKDKILVVAITPGWVVTDMGGKGASLTPAESVNGIVDTMGKLGEKENGLLVTRKGNVMAF